VPRSTSGQRRSLPRPTPRVDLDRDCGTLPRREAARLRNSCLRRPCGEVATAEEPAEKKRNAQIMTPNALLLKRRGAVVAKVADTTLRKMIHHHDEAILYIMVLLRVVSCVLCITYIQCMYYAYYSTSLLLWYYI
jgi:hypothetical protein